MYERIKRFFDDEKIEYFSVLSCQDCRVVRPEIMGRENFTPRSIILFLVPYYAGETVNISRYAASRDYHIYINNINERLMTNLRSVAPKNHFKGYGDHSPIDERGAALISGLGILGNNGLIINEKYGSYVFIGEIITDIEPRVLCAVSPKEPVSCEGCGACKIACPTGRLIGGDKFCLSEITQKKGELSDTDVKLMKKVNTVWGYDECQTCCPHNRSPRITPIEFFLENRIVNLTREVLDSMDKSEFSTRAFSWRGRKTVERNIDYIEK